MSEIVLYTFDWVPEPPRGFVRDFRIRWALEEAALPYRIESVPFKERGADHFRHQPFGQVPWLTDGDFSLFESGAMLLYVGERSRALLPADGPKRYEVVQWLFAAVNSMEMPALPWALFRFSGEAGDSPERRQIDDFLETRLGHLEAVLTKREWLTESFSIADIAMADVLRLVDRYGGLAKRPACRDYLARAKSRPAFAKALADQLAHFAAAD